MGALNYIGSDEYIAGRAGGEELVELGVTNGVCVNTLPGVANVDARCTGMIDAMTEAGANAETFPMPSTAFGDPAAIAEGVKAYLLEHPDVGGVLAIGAGEADAAAVGIAQAGKTGQVVLGNFDFSEATLDRIQHGEQAFAIDQQPYLQSVLAITLLAGHIDFGTDLPTAPVLTGPGIIDASNVEATIAGVEISAR